MRFTVAALVLTAGLAAPVLADVITSTSHPHDPSPVTTWGTGPGGQHQHRTPHDPRAGTYSHIGAGNAYVATKVWTDRVQHSTLDGHDPFAHGHQDVAARWAIHYGTVGDNPFPGDVGPLALQRTAEAFTAWMNAGNVIEANWPNTDNDITGPTAPDRAIIHSSVNWVRTTETGNDHEVHVNYTGAGLGSAWGAYNSVSRIISINPMYDWYYGTSTDPAVDPHKFDFLSVITHEVGHVIGKGHFGALGTHIMTDAAGQPFRDGHFLNTHGHSGGTAHVAGDAHAIPNATALELAGGTFRTVDLDAEHGVRDLYSIPGLVPAPGTAALLGLGGLMASRRRRA